MGKVMVKTSGPKNYQAISNAFGGHPFRQAAIRRCRSNDLGLSLTGQNDSSQNLHRAIDLVLTPRGEAKK